jgi:hypothetical protein
MNKKKLVLFFISISLILISINLVSASIFNSNADFFNGAADTIIQWIKDILGPFFQVILGSSGFDEFFWAKILLLFLLYAVIYTILVKVEMFKHKEGIVFIVSTIVSIFAVRFMDNEGFIEFILMPSGALGISLVIFLPILIWFFFMHESGLGPIGRRMGWILFSVVFVVLWVKRASQVPSELNWIYGIAGAIVLICFFFDEGIHQYFGISQARATRRDRIKMEISEISGRIREIRHDNPNPSNVDEENLRVLERRLQRLYRQL